MVRCVIFICILSAALAGIARAEAADPSAQMLRQFYPHGIHKIETSKHEPRIQWDAEVLENGKAVHKLREFKTIDEFKAAFLEAKLDKEAYINILNMWDESGRKGAAVDAELNEALLAFLRKEGYEESNVANLKKYYPNGALLSLSLGKPGEKAKDEQLPVHWTWRHIENDRLKVEEKTFESADECKKAFDDAKMDKKTTVEVWYRGQGQQNEPELVDIAKYISEKGYKVGGGRN